MNNQVSMVKITEKNASGECETKMWTCPQSIFDKISKVVSDVPSKWMEDAEYRIANEDWLNISQKIALKILRYLREINCTSDDLRYTLGITEEKMSNIVKGRENLDLKMIAKIETALCIKIINL